MYVVAPSLHSCHYVPGVVLYIYRCSLHIPFWLMASVHSLVIFNSSCFERSAISPAGSSNSNDESMTDFLSVVNINVPFVWV